MDMEVIKEIGNYLQKSGWSKIKYRKKLPESAGTIDVIAQSKGLKKKNLLVVVATDI